MIVILEPILSYIFVLLFRLKFPHRALAKGSLILVYNLSKNYCINFIYEIHIYF